MDELFQSLQTVVPSSLGRHSWYIIAATALTASGSPDSLTPLYAYLQGPKSPLTDAEKGQVSARLQDVLGKAFTLIGVPLVVAAMVALARGEREWEGEEGKDGKKSGEGEVEKEWCPPNLDDTTTNRGTAFLQTLYQQNLAPIFATFGRHAPYMEWLEHSVIYGLFLSDHTLLTPIESSLTILTSIMCQGIRAATMWHLRGLRRLGVSEEDVEKVQEGVRAVAKWAGKSEKEVEGWIRVREIRDEL